MDHLVVLSHDRAPAGPELRQSVDENLFSAAVTNAWERVSPIHSLNNSYTQAKANHCCASTILRPLHNLRTVVVAPSSVFWEFRPSAPTAPSARLYLTPTAMK